MTGAWLGLNESDDRITSRCRAIMANVITIYTDASHCEKTQTGGWACWIKYSKFETINASGFFKDKCFDSTEAEMKAIANAISIVTKRLKPKDTIIVVVTDSAMGMAYIKTGVKKPGKKYVENWAKKTAIADSIKRAVPSCCELRVNKVKAHSKEDGKRSYVNNLVDKAAYKKLQEARKKTA